MPKARTGTCEGCGKRRKLTYPEPVVFLDALNRPRRPITEEERKQSIEYYGLCSECFPKVKTQDDIIKLRKQREVKPRSEKARFAYPIIGGPLDGLHATTSDFEQKTDEKFRGNSWFREGGMYGHLANEYEEFNASRGSRKKIGAAPSMVFIHKTLLKPLIHPRDR